MKYKVGDLLVKWKGDRVVLMICDIKYNSYFDEDSMLTLLDMKIGDERKYSAKHVSTWFFYKHYPVIPDEE